MKYPKELQKNKNPSEEHFKRLKEKVLQTFRSEFIKIHRKFEGSEGREVKFIDSRDIGKSSREPINLTYDEKELNVEINNSLSDENVFGKPNFKNRFDYYREYFKHIAHHEYGHSFLTPTTFDLSPIEKKDFLRQYGIRDYKLLPVNKRNEFENVILNSEFIKVEGDLKTVSLKLLYEQFRQFHATYMIIVKNIDDLIPNKSLELDYLELSSTLSTYRKRKEEFFRRFKPEQIIDPFQINPLYKIVWEIMWYTHRFYIFNKWDELNDLFNKYKMKSLLDFLHISYELFKVISDIHIDIDIIQKIIIKLSKSMDIINYTDLIFNNKFDGQHQQELERFKQELEDEK